jgi:hypothetical protein
MQQLRKDILTYLWSTPFRIEGAQYQRKEFSVNPTFAVTEPRLAVVLHHCYYKSCIG